jgi:hypothetical protein
MAQLHGTNGKNIVSQKNFTHIVKEKEEDQ